LKPVVVGSPGLLLTLHLARAHDSRSAQEPKKSELGEATEKEARHGGEILEPLEGGDVVDMPIVSERHPNVDIREKK
jgi:hypothetical protein